MQENKVGVAEMRMKSMRWMCEVTKLDKIIHERIRGQRKWRESQRQSMQECEMHVMHTRREEHYILRIGRRAMESNVRRRRKIGMPI